MNVIKLLLPKRCIITIAIILYMVNSIQLYVILFFVTNFTLIKIFTEIGIHVVTQNNTYTRRLTKCDIISIIFNENRVNSKRFP